MMATGISLYSSKRMKLLWYIVTSQSLNTHQEIGECLYFFNNRAIPFPPGLLRPETGVLILMSNSTSSQLHSNCVTLTVTLIAFVAPLEPVQCTDLSSETGNHVHPKFTV